MRMPTLLQQSIANYLLHLENKEGAAGATARNYRFYLERFVAITRAKRITDINASSVQKFRGALANTRSQRGDLMRPATINYHLIAVRSLCTFLQSRGQSVLNPDRISLIKVSTRPRQSPNISEIRRLLEAPLNNASADITQKRDKAILELLSSTGLKVAELAGLTKHDIDFRDNIVAIGGLRSKARHIPFTNQARYWIRQYLGERTDMLPALFIRHDKAKKKQLDKAADTYRLTPRSIQRMIKKYVKSAGLDPRTSPQSLRNAYAAHLLEQGEDPASVQKIMGHATKATTTRYKKR